MAKKMFSVLVLAVLITGGVFAQKMSLSLDVVPLFTGFIASEQGKNGDKDKTYFGLGADFDYLVAPRYSIGARTDVSVFTYDKLTGIYFDLAVKGRVWTMSPLDKLFVEAALGFSSISAKNDGATLDDADVLGFLFAMKAGWRENIGRVFIEPALGYVLAKEDKSGYGATVPGGWQLGFSLGMKF